MHNQTKISFLIFTLTLFLCFNSIFVGNTAAQVNIELVPAPADSKYTFESISIDGVESLAVTASSDFGDYAGYTLSDDGEKEVAFTLLDGVFTTHDFPGSRKTHFYALGNNGLAAGHYEDSDGVYRGVVLENGELRQYDFQNSVQTEIYGISDTKGELTGNYTDASGVRRGFSGNTIVEVPEAAETYAYFTTESGAVIGSYVGVDGTYHGYVRAPDGRFIFADLLEIPNLEYFFPYGVNDVGVTVVRAKAVGDIPRTYVGRFGGMHELRFPEAVSTQGWNINKDGSVVGYYDSADGRRRGFIARPAAPVEDRPVVTPASFTYTFESIDVPRVEFVALTASSDFEDYAGYTRSADGKKTVGFTLIDGVFTTYDFPGSQNTYFYALGNNGSAAGHYEDSDGLYHGVVLEKGELRQYDFPDAVQTEIYGISDATGALTGNFIDASGVRRGFSGDTIIEVPGAAETYADFVSASGAVVGSYIDRDGIYQAYARAPDGRIGFADILTAADFDYLFLHGINDVGIIVGRAKQVDDVPRTYVGRFGQLHELRFPGAVSTEGWNINQDGSVVGHYDSADGRRHGFIARPVPKPESDHFGNVYNVTLAKGLNMLSVPLAPIRPLSAKTLAGLTGATAVITLDSQRFIGWTPGAPNDGFPIEGGKGYIVNVPETREFAFVGAPWTDQTKAAASPPAISQKQTVWAFVVSGHLNGKPAYDGYRVIVRNLRTSRTITATVEGDYFAAATADLARRSVVEVGDVIELHVIGPDGNVESHTARFHVSPEHLANAVLSVRLDGIGKPEGDMLLQNYPNPFNPETWIPYQLSEDTPVSISIYDTTGKLIRTLSIGFQSAGFYNSRGRAAYWDGRNDAGEHVSSGLYFYQLRTPSFEQTRRLVVIK